MDIVRTSATRKIPRRIVYAALVLGAIVLTTVAFARLEPAAPPVEATSLVIETVGRGPLTRAVRGSGVLVPENVRWIAAATDGRVERVLLHPGTQVTADSVIRLVPPLILSIAEADEIVAILAPLVKAFLAEPQP